MKTGKSATLNKLVQSEKNLGNRNIKAKRIGMFTVLTTSDGINL